MKFRFVNGFISKLIASSAIVDNVTRIKLRMFYTSNVNLVTKIGREQVKS